MGIKSKRRRRAQDASLGIWVLRNVHPGTSVVMTTQKSRTPEQPTVFITNTHTASHLTQDLFNSMTSFVLASYGLSHNPRVTFSLLIRKQASSIVVPWCSVLQVWIEPLHSNSGCLRAHWRSSSQDAGFSRQLESSPTTQQLRLGLDDQPLSKCNFPATVYIPSLSMQ